MTRRGRLPSPNAGSPASRTRRNAAGIETRAFPSTFWLNSPLNASDTTCCPSGLLFFSVAPVLPPEHDSLVCRPLKRKRRIERLPLLDPPSVPFLGPSLGRPGALATGGVLLACAPVVWDKGGACMRPAYRLVGSWCPVCFFVSPSSGKQRDAMGMDGWQWEFLGTEGFILVPWQARHSILRAF